MFVLAFILGLIDEGIIYTYLLNLLVINILNNYSLILLLQINQVGVIR